MAIAKKSLTGIAPKSSNLTTAKKMKSAPVAGEKLETASKFRTAKVGYKIATGKVALGKVALAKASVSPMATTKKFS